MGGICRKCGTEMMRVEDLYLCSVCDATEVVPGPEKRDPRGPAERLDLFGGESGSDEQAEKPEIW